MRETAENAEFIDDWCDRWEANFWSYHPEASHRQVIRAFEMKVKFSKLLPWARKRALSNIDLYMNPRIEYLKF